ncbi:MAG: VWA domain-containing protein [Acidobacteria bacterium]|nr:VWA domain-containing protein [Acidobacteriota bacterium]
MKRQFCDLRRITLLSAVVLAAFLSVVPQTSLAQQKSKAAAFAPPKAEKENKGRIIISTELVSLTVTVTDKQGRYVSGLDRRAFAVYDDDVRQEIGFFSDRDAPASIGVIFDVSGSMSGERINRARQALARFIQTSHPEDEYSLISFNDSAQLLLDRARDGGALLSQFGGPSPDGNTALYDAVALGIETLARSRYAKRALIVISDGEDNRSRSTFNEIKRKLQESGMTIYTIVIGPLLPRSNGGAVMHQLASASGGNSFFPNNTEAMSEGFEQIALELRHQYSIGYMPANITNDGRWRRLKVFVTPPAGSPRLIVRSRKGYYAVASMGGWVRND